MAYEVTANRKRPSRFDGLLGQEFVVASLKNSLDTGRIAPSYLFSGPRGVGKTSAARILARSLNCPGGPSSDGCPDFEEGDAISRGNALDVIEIDGASNTSVNDVRQIKDEVLFAPQSARYKIYIIDEVHMLSNSAFNALLKTIEEPPPYIVFIFATTEIQKVPATIRSRCQQFHFRLIPMSEIVRSLRDAAQDAGLEAEEDALLWMAREASGSLRDAFTLFDQVASFSSERITLADIQQKLGLVGFEQLDELVRLLSEGKYHRALELVDSLLTAGISIEQITIDLGEYFRTALLVKHGIRKTGILGRPADHISEEVLEAFTEIQLEKGVDMVLELFRNLRYSLNPRFELELVVSRLGELTSYLSPREMLDEIARLRGGKPARHALLAGGGALGGGSTDGPMGPQADTSDSANTADSAGTPGGNVTDGDVADGSRTGNDTRESERAEGENINLGSEEPASEDNADRGQEEPQEAYPEPVRSQIISAIRERKLALGSVLERSIAWTMHEGALILQFNNGYHARTVKQDNTLIREVIRDITGDSVPVKAAIIQNEQHEVEQAQHSEQVDLVKRVFRGEVVDGQEESS